MSLKSKNKSDKKKYKERSLILSFRATKVFLNLQRSLMLHLEPHWKRMVKEIGGTKTWWVGEGGIMADPWVPPPLNQTRTRKTWKWKKKGKEQIKYIKMIWIVQNFGYVSSIFLRIVPNCSCFFEAKISSLGSTCNIRQTSSYWVLLEGMASQYPPQSSR